MTIQQFIERAIRGGWKGYEDRELHGRQGDTHLDENYGWMNMRATLLDPEAWEAVGRVEGWGNSKYRACEMKMPFYHREPMRGTGAIVGESKDGKQWYVRWDVNRNGTPTKGAGAKQPYPKKNIVERSAEKNWVMVWHRMIDALAEGKSISEYLESL